MQRFATVAAFVAVMVAAAAAIMAVSAQASDMSGEASYQAWCTKWDKTFCSVGNRVQRSEAYLQGFEAFQRQVARIERHNSDRNSTYKMGLNEFFDVETIGRLASRQSGAQTAQPSHGSSSGASTTAAGTYKTGVPVAVTCNYGSIASLTPITTATATAVDNTANLKTSLFNQGNCFCCSAVVARDLLSYKAGSAVSVDQLTACANNAFNANYASLGCKGGYTATYIKYNNDRHGCVSEAAYPWNGAGACLYTAPVTVGRVVGVGLINGENNYASGVASYGVLGVMIVADINFASYYTGIFNTNPSGHDANHALLMVGYRGLLPVSDGSTPYHICRNSWGAWGIGGQGIVNIRSGVNMCSIGNFGAIAVY